eukprot:CAMPEP_0195539854 /NCGR_PEP_ID=MMETSP0794_2-20130614/50275_1 /TAXON_ID=515487 /ORGANISM="Stephanopyxis turris, Strain CCMP 815" /LENGTH=461 /DNA_ID=CAMNT_0040673909 /DNA_START=263 /DNA_END=1645 /DNA_ORIENTATION=+
MTLGIIGYIFLVLCSLAYFEANMNQKQKTLPPEEENGSVRNGFYYGLVVFGGVVLGCGGALLWTAQGRLLMQYARVMSENENITILNNVCDPKPKYARVMSENENINILNNVCDPKPSFLESINSSTVGPKNEENDQSCNMMEMNKSASSKKTGILFGTFWAIFQSSAIFGGIISFVCYSDEEGSDEDQLTVLLYVIFLGFMFVGIFATQLLLPPSMLLINSSNNFVGSTQLMPNHPDNTHSKCESDPLLCGTNESKQRKWMYQEHATSNEDDTSDLPWKEEIIQTLVLFRSKSMFCLSFLFFYTGFCQPYQMETFGNRFFDKKTIGLEMIVFFSAEIVSALFVGKLLDPDHSFSFSGHKASSYKTKRKPPSSFESPRSDVKIPTHCSHNRDAAILCLVIFVIVTIVGNIIVLSLEFNCAVNSSKCGMALDFTDRANIFYPTIAYACWGFSDGLIQTYCYW